MSNSSELSSDVADNLDSESDDLESFTNTFMAKAQRLKNKSKKKKTQESSSDEDFDSFNSSSKLEQNAGTGKVKIMKKHATKKASFTNEISLSKQGSDDGGSEDKENSEEEHISNAEDEGEMDDEDAVSDVSDREHSPGAEDINQHGEQLEGMDSRYSDSNKSSDCAEDEIPSMSTTDNIQQGSEDGSDTSASEDEEIPSMSTTDEIQQGSEDGSDTSGSEDEEQVEKQDSKDTEESDEKKVYAKVREEIANLPFNELQKLKERVGLKAYNQALFGKSDTQNHDRERFKRANKNRPMEMSSKRPVTRRRDIVQIKKKVFRDPRFDDLSGEYSDEYFKKNFAFLSDVKQREKEVLTNKLRKEKDENKKEELERLLKNIGQQERRDQQMAARQRKESDLKQHERALVADGKRPFYLKKADKRKLELADKFRDLQKSGKVDNFLAKKRKRNAAKDRRRLPRSEMGPS